MSKTRIPPNNVAITVCGRTYTVKCSKQEKPTLEKAVERVEKTMAKITHGHKHPSPEQIAIVTALNLAAQLEAQLTKNPVIKPTQQQQKDQKSIDTMVDRCHKVFTKTA